MRVVRAMAPCNAAAVEGRSTAPLALEPFYRSLEEAASSTSHRRRRLLDRSSSQSSFDAEWRELFPVPSSEAPSTPRSTTATGAAPPLSLGVAPPPSTPARSAPSAAAAPQPRPTRRPAGPLPPPSDSTRRTSSSASSPSSSGLGVGLASSSPPSPATSPRATTSPCPTARSTSSSSSSAPSTRSSPAARGPTNRPSPRQGCACAGGSLAEPVEARVVDEEAAAAAAAAVDRVGASASGAGHAARGVEEDGEVEGQDARQLVGRHGGPQEAVARLEKVRSSSLAPLELLRV